MKTLSLCLLVALFIAAGCATMPPQQGGGGGITMMSAAKRRGVDSQPSYQAPAAYRASPEEIAAEEAAINSASSAAAPSEEAKDRMAKGKAWAAAARGPEDFERAAETMKGALRLAPGWSSGWYNLAVAEEGAGRWADAQRHLKYYLKLKPDAADREAVRMKAAELSIREERGDRP